MESGRRLSVTSERDGAVMAAAAPSSGKRWNIGIWLVQAILAFIFVTIGSLRMTLPVDTLVEMGWCTPMSYRWASFASSRRWSCRAAWA